MFHHFTFYGFMLCFAATSVATLYHYLLDYHAPYPIMSLPVQLGIWGGIGLLIGPAGLLWLNLRRHPLHGDPAQRPMDRGFIVLLFLIASAAWPCWPGAIHRPWRCCWRYTWVLSWPCF
jgi:citrate/tricarballylate utilization protein